MLFRPSTLLPLAALASVALASVPSDLSSGFDVNAITLQVSFTGNSVDGFADGSTISSQEASTTPTFALGDSSGINTAISFVIMMVDTTDSNPTLHYLQGGFKADGDQTGLASTTAPALNYQAPGTLGETGTRNYVFLLYQQRSSSLTGLPSKGSSFDINAFQGANSLKAPEAGISMSVDVGGSGSSNSNNQPAQSSSSGSQQTTESSQPSSTQAAATAQQTTFQTSSAAASSTSSSPSSTQSINSSLFASITSDTTELSKATLLPTAAASVGAAGQGPQGGVTSEIPTSLSGTAVIAPTGSAGAASTAAASAKATGAAVAVRVSGREVLAGLGAVAIMGILL